MIRKYHNHKQRGRATQPHGSKYFARRPPPQPNLRMGSRGQTFFSENGHVAYQIKWNQLQQHGSKYFAHRPSHLPPTLGLGQKVKPKLYQNMVMLHVKFKGRKYRLTLKQTSTFSEQCHVAYQIKGNHECSNMIATLGWGL